MPGSVAVRSRTCASELPQDYKSDTLPLDYRATKCFNIADYGTLPIGASGGQSAKCYQRIVDACDAVVILLGDHKRRQVGRVTGREDDGEESPDTRHEPTRHTTRTSHTVLIRHPAEH